MDIYPHQLCGKTIPFREAGKKIRNLIEENWSSGQIYEIRFEGKSVDSSSFFDEAFALLLDDGHTIEDLRSRITFPDINDGDKYLLNYAIIKRLKQLKSKLANKHIAPKS